MAALVFFAALLGMAGPLPLRRAALRAAPLALLVAALMSWAGLRYPFAANLAGEAIPVLAGLALTFLPLPFLIAAEGGNWRRYPTLFVQAWGTVIRQAAAWLFVALVWLVFLLSHQLLKMVGVPVLGHLVDAPVFVALFTGAMLGLGIAVIHEMSGVVAPDLLIRLLRLFLPPLLIVLGVFGRPAVSWVRGAVAAIFRRQRSCCSVQALASFWSPRRQSGLTAWPRNRP